MVTFTRTRLVLLQKTNKRIELNCGSLMNIPRKKYLFKKSEKYQLKEKSELLYVGRAFENLNLKIIFYKRC